MLILPVLMRPDRLGQTEGQEDLSYLWTRRGAQEEKRKGGRDCKEKRERATARIQTK